MAASFCIVVNTVELLCARGVDGRVRFRSRGGYARTPERPSSPPARIRAGRTAWSGGVTPGRSRTRARARRHEPVKVGHLRGGVFVSGIRHRSALPEECFFKLAGRPDAPQVALRYARPAMAARILIAAGGTAGHVAPALVGRRRAARARGGGGVRGHRRARRGPHGPGRRLPARDVQGGRASSAAISAQLARSVGLAAMAPAACGRILRRVRPDAVLGGGGYVSGPMVAAAAALRIPTAVTETDGHLGLANRLAAPAGPAGAAGDADRRAGRRAVPRGGPAGRPALLHGHAGRGPRVVRHRRRRAGGRGVRRIARRRAAERGRGRGVRRGGSGRAAGAAGDGARQARGHAATRPAAGVRVLRLDAAAAARRRPRACAAPAARCGRWPRPARRRSSCPGRAPPATTRRQTPGTSWAGAVVVPDAELDGSRLRSEVAGAAGRRAAPGRRWRRRCAELARPDAASDVADELLALAGTRAP